MAVNPYTKLVTPVQLEEAAASGSDTVVIDITSGAPDGNTEPQASAPKGSVVIRDDQTDDLSPLYLKVDDASSDDDWVLVIIDKDEGAHSMEGNWTWTSDKKLLLRDSAIFIHSNADGYLHIQADTAITLGDGTNDLTIASDGTVSLAGTATVTKKWHLSLDVGGGTATTETWNNSPSINLDADNEEFFFSFVAPDDWDAASDMTIVYMVGNEIAEDDGDDVSITGTVKGYADGETMGTTGQTVAFLQDLTGGDEAINIVNRVTGTINYDEATHPVASGDVVTIKNIVNLAAGAETTGPLHIVGAWVEYTASKLGA